MEMNGAFLLHFLIWTFIMVLLITIGVVGYWSLQYRQFSAAMQDTIARCGTFHVGKGPANEINNPEIMNLIHKYHNVWVVEPVPNLASYNGATLTDKAVHVIVGNKGMRQITLTDFESANGNGRSSFTGLKRTKVTPDYLYNKREMGAPSKAELAASYNNGESVEGIKPQYLNLSSFDANWLDDLLSVNSYPSGWMNHSLTSDIAKKNKLYYPSKDHYFFNGVRNFKDNESYEFARDNIWNLLIEANGNREPQTKYAGQVAYTIVPNVKQISHDRYNADGLRAGTALFAFNLRLFNSGGTIQLVTNQVRSVATTGPNADVPLYT